MKEFRLSIAGIVACLALASCTTTSSVATTIDGHPYRTKANCQRVEPLGKFDPKCDEPLVGFKGFSPDIIVPQVGGGSGFSL